MRVLVIGGGISDEREVSLRSSKGVYNAALKAGHEADFYDWDGSWGSWEWLNKNVNNFDVVLPILHGEGGEDGKIQEFLESKKVKYLGTDSAASRLCFDKQKTKKLLDREGIKTPEAEIVDKTSYISSELAQKRHVLKPVSGGSSIDTLIGVTLDEVDEETIEILFSHHPTFLLEEYIKGVETTVPILEGKTLPIIEIVPPEGETFDYENKYDGSTKELCPPEHIAKHQQNELQILGEKIHKLLGCRHLSRTDVIVAEDGAYYVLETNTVPGLTDASLFPLAAQTAGLAMSEFIDYLITLTARS